MIKILTFRLNNSLFAIPATDIREVNRITHMVQTVEESDSVLGLINFHGKTAPVLNLKQLLKINPMKPKSTAMWLAVEWKETLSCLAVDEVTGFLDLSEHDLDPSPNAPEGPVDICVKYYARVGETLLPILDVNLILAKRATGDSNPADGRT
jgi:chemotaxis signal transduction protein